MDEKDRRKGGGGGWGLRKDRWQTRGSEDNGGLRRDRVWDEYQSVFPRKATGLTLADWSNAVLHCVKGANNRLSNGIVPLRIVCAQVGSLGVPTHQVSISLNKTGLTIGPEEPRSVLLNISKAFQSERMRFDTLFSMETREKTSWLYCVVLPEMPKPTKLIALCCTPALWLKRAKISNVEALCSTGRYFPSLQRTWDFFFTQCEIIDFCFLL